MTRIVYGREIKDENTSRVIIGTCNDGVKILALGRRVNEVIHTFEVNSK